MPVYDTLRAVPLGEEKMKRLCWLVLIVTLLTACDGSVLPGAATAAPGGTRVPSQPTATPRPSSNFRLLTVPVGGDVILSGAFYPPAEGPAPAVLLLHQVGGQKEDWAPFATRLQAAGYAVLALDLRGHGESGGETEWAAMADDVARAWEVMAAQPEVDAERTAVVGASLGANLALVAGAGLPLVRAVVLLSPGLDYRGVRTEEAMLAYGDRAVLIAASQDDTYAYSSAQTLDQLAQGDHALALYAEAGHGIEMLQHQPDLNDLILGWLRTRLER